MPPTAQDESITVTTQGPEDFDGSASKSPRTGFLSGDQLRALHGPPRRGLLLLMLPWGVALASLFCLWLIHLYGWPTMGGIAAAVLFVIIGWSQFTISNALHEAVHHNIFEKRYDWLAALLLAWPIGFPMTYRQVHLDHHRYFGEPVRDPDYSTYSQFPVSKLAFTRWLLFNLSGIAAARQFFLQDSRHSDPRSLRLRLTERLCLIVMHSVILAAFWVAFGTPLTYLVFWILPLGTVAKALSATRTLCEHGDASGRPVLRTITGTPLQNAVMGLFGFDYHAEHHLYPTVPFAALPRLHEHHEHAIADNAGRAVPNVVYKVFEGGHVGLLNSWLRTLPLTIVAKPTK